MSDFATDEGFALSFGMASAPSLPISSWSLRVAPGGSFARLVRFVRDELGEEVARRLEALRNAPLEHGENRLQLESVRHALRFVLQHAWPLQEFYTTPRGRAQLTWKLHGNAKLVARFASDGTVAFAVVDRGRIRLTGECPFEAFIEAVDHLRREVARPEGPIGQATPAGSPFSSSGHTESKYRSSLLSTGFLRPRWESVGSGVSA